MTIRIHIATTLLVAAGLAGCSSHVDDFKDRMIGQNAQVHDLLYEESLLNVARASRFEALTFFALARTTGYRQQNLNIGLPAVTIGPNRTSLQRQFTFSGNSTGETVQGLFESNPLVGDTFQQGMMTPISTRQLAMLVEAHGREAVLLAAIEQIRVNEKVWLIPNDIKSADKVKYMKNNAARVESHVFRNDPYNNESDGPGLCSANNFLPSLSNGHDRDAFGGDAKYVNSVLEKITYQKSGKFYVIGDMRKCHFAKFRALLTALLHVGLTVDVYEADKKEQVTQPTAPADAGKADKKDTGAQALTPGTFCLSAALVDPPIELIQGPTLLGKFARCEYVPSKNETASPTFRGKDSTDRGERWSYVDDVTFRIRSPVGVYNYLGELVRLYNGGKGPAGLFTYATYDSKARYGLAESSPFLNVVVDGSQRNCAVSVEDAGRTYCVKQDEVSTLNLLAMLQDLRNLNTKASDLNASFTVRVP